MADQNKRVLRKDEIRDLIFDFLSDNFSFQPGDLDDQTDLLNGWVIDSLGVIQIVMFLEQQFSCEFNSTDVNSDNFQNILSLMEFVYLKQGAGRNH